jgi:carbon-monoxide dehydrogenase medium subunit
MRKEETMPSGFEVLRPRTRAEAVELLARPKAAPLTIAPRPDSLWETGVESFIDLGLLDLDYIREEADGWVHVGAGTSLQTIFSDPLLKARTRGLLNRAAWQVAAESIRNLSSLWGAIQARRGSPEFTLALLALDARVHLLGARETHREIRFSEPGNGFVKVGELVIEASFRALPETGCGWALERVARTPRDEAIVAALAVVEAADGVAHHVRLALGGANPLPGRLPAAEKLLEGQAWSAEGIEKAACTAAENCAPGGDFRGSPEYRRAMAQVVIHRALQKAGEQAGLPVADECGGR